MYLKRLQFTREMPGLWNATFQNQITLNSNSRNTYFTLNHMTNFETLVVLLS